MAMLVAAKFELEGPIGMFDTERGAKWHQRRVERLGGRQLVTPPERDDGTSPRSLEELTEFLKAAKKAKCSVVIIDSLTHVLEDCREKYFKANKISSPEASDYGPADKPFTALMKRLTDSSMNVICCAREKQQYGRYKNSKGKMVTGPVGVKFGAKESAYDFDLLIHMQTVPKKGEPDERVMTVEKDRSRTVHGKSFKYPYKISEIFSPYLDALRGAESEGDPS